MKQYNLIYTERGIVEEAGHEIFKYFTPFTLEFEGFYIQVEHLLGVSDSYKLMGMDW